MRVSPSKENILKKIRQALSHSTPVPFPNSEGNSSVFQPSRQENEIEFAEQFTKLQGKFVYCASLAELAEQVRQLVTNKTWTAVFCREPALQAIFREPLQGILTSEDLADSDAGITSCEKLIARTGSILMSTGQESGRTVSVYAPVHICVAYTSQLVYDIRDGLENIKEKYRNKLPSLITLATGPSRTADIEKTLVVGVHGPGEVYVFLVEEE
jgi:L-lactate dehydrogenase complex protein LldG